MNGSMLNGWSYAWEEIWAPLTRSKAAPIDLWSELVSAVIPAPKRPKEVHPEVDSDGNILNSDVFMAKTQDYWRSRTKFDESYRNYTSAAQGSESDIFFKMFVRSVTDEGVARKIVSDTYSALKDSGYHELASEFRELVVRYVRTRNVLCTVTEQCEIAPAIEELMVRFVAEIEGMAGQNTQTHKALNDVKEQFTDLRMGFSHLRIRNAVSRFFVLMEAFAETENSQFRWSEGNIAKLDLPHVSFANIFTKLYSMRGDYPLLVHAGSVKSTSRDLVEKDLVSLTFLLFAALPYLATSTATDDGKRLSDVS